VCLLCASTGCSYGLNTRAFPGMKINLD
jgi:hypothetical protein